MLRGDFVVLYWNRCLEDWTHLNRNQLLGKNICQYFPHLLEPKYATRLKQIFAGGPPSIFSSQIHKYLILSPLPDGRLRIQHTTVTAVPAANEGEYYALLSIQDVTELTQQVQNYRTMRDRALAEVKERQRAEEALRSREEQLQAVLDAVPGFVSWIGSDLRYLGVNHHLATTFNLTTDAFIGQEVGFLELSPGFAEFMYQFFDSSSQAASQEVDMQVKGLFRNYLIAAQKYLQGTTAVFVGIDITERKQAEQEIRNALAKEKEFSELQSRFITMTSHEFRTPLTTILGSAELLEHYSHKWTEEKKLGHIHRIQGSVKHLVQVLEDVMLIGKAEAGKLEFKPAPLDLIQFCCNLVEELQLSAGSQPRIVFTHSGQESNWITAATPQELAGYGSLLACMDEKLLRHILINLLSNAIKYSPQGGTVDFELAVEDGQAIFRVKDRGIGILPEDLQQLFEAFHRGNNVGNISGTGLGLAIVKRSVNLHGGWIAVESQVGVGSVFTVKLPLK